MSIIGKIKIFWSEHGNPILLAILIALGIVLVVQGLNQYAIQREKKELQQEKSKVNNSISTNIKDSKEKEDKKLIRIFLEYNQNERTDKAYALLSEKCKQEIYPTLLAYEEKYYNQYFKEISNIDINPEEGFYKITFYKNDALETGIASGTIKDIHYYTVEKEENKININTIK